MKLMEGKRGVVFGVSNTHGIAYGIAKLFKEKIKAKTGAVVYTKRLSKYARYEIDGVKVLLTPLYKVVPHIVPSEQYLSNILEQPLKDLASEGFVPNIITAHFQKTLMQSTPSYHIISYHIISYRAL